MRRRPSLTHKLLDRVASVAFLMAVSLHAVAIHAEDDRSFVCKGELRSPAVGTLDGKWILGCGTEPIARGVRNGILCFWDAESRRLRGTLKPHAGGTADLKLSRDG